MREWDFQEEGQENECLGSLSLPDSGLGRPGTVLTLVCPQWGSSAALCSL